MWDTIFDVTSLTIWSLLFLNFILAVGGALYARKYRKKKERPPLAEYPTVTILVPAHNEELVIRKTVLSLFNFDYPKDRYEILVINDNSQDKTGEVLSQLQREFPDRALRVITTDMSNGGKGKSNALNIALPEAKGEILAIYDADNTPEPDALRILVEHLLEDKKLAAVTGKFRTRNKKVNLLTRFINVETIDMQYLNQAGRNQFFKLGMLPGTNYVIYRHIVEEAGGWDVEALTEDAELSYRIYGMGYRIKFVPLAVSWEQEPQRLGILFRQRSRWIRGNFYVFRKYFHRLFLPRTGAVRMDILYYIAFIMVMLVAVTCSNVMAVLGWLGYISLTTPLASLWYWLAASALFIITHLLSLLQEPEEVTFTNILVSIALLAYAKLWHIMFVYAVFLSFKRKRDGQKSKWDKTTRFEEKEKDPATV